MEKNNEATTLHNELNVMNNDDDDNYEHLSIEELCVKIKTFRNLCLGNKINTTNAFDIDMIGYFLSWLEKRKKNYNEDVGSFQEIADYLEASAKVYGFRVDNASESTSRLVEQFRAMNYKKNVLKKSDANDQHKNEKPKRTKLMLTTADKLRRKTTENDCIDPSIKQGIPTIDFNELFETGRSSKYMSSLYFDTTLKEEILMATKEETKNDNNMTMTMRNVKKKFSKRVVCPQFGELVAEHDKVINEIENHFLDGIENQFDPFQNFTTDPDLTLDYEDQEKSNLDGLLDCIDNVIRDYSFFNPKLLANWKGPEAWKAQAMVKALKSCKPSVKRQIFENNDVCMQPKTVKKRTKFTNKIFKVDWVNMHDVKNILDKKVKSQEKLSPTVLQKWVPLENLCDTKNIVVDIKYKFSFLEYLEIQPDWFIKKRVNETETEKDLINASTYQNIYDHEVSTRETLKHCDNSVDKNILENECDQIQSSFDFDISIQEPNNEKDNFLKELKTESKMDIGLLKKEISKIIDLECVEVDKNCDWSSRLSFKNLLLKLINIHHEGISVAIVYVGLLHLTNERGLKLFQEFSTINDDQEIFIAKPICKT